MSKSLQEQLLQAGLAKLNYEQILQDNTVIGTPADVALAERLIAQAPGGDDS